jgi:hypothetical protein
MYQPNFRNLIVVPSSATSDERFNEPHASKCLSLSCFSHRQLAESCCLCCMEMNRRTSCLALKRQHRVPQTWDSHSSPKWEDDWIDANAIVGG